MTKKPDSTGDKPIRTVLDAQVAYSFCPCGKSKKQPFCDSAHKTEAPEFKSIKFCSIKTEVAMLCMCKQSKKMPYCDGAHKNCDK